MFVRRKRSNKRKRRFYEAIEFNFSINFKEISVFLGNLGKVEIESQDNIISGLYIETRDGRKICTGQYLLKDDRRKRIISFDQTIFYDFYDIWNT
jgi:hypothetical protein